MTLADACARIQRLANATYKLPARVRLGQTTAGDWEASLGCLPGPDYDAGVELPASFGATPEAALAGLRVAVVEAAQARLAALSAEVDTLIAALAERGTDPETPPTT